MNGAIIKQMEQEYALRRMAQRAELEDRINRLYAKYPELARLDEAQRNLKADKFRAIRKSEPYDDIEEGLQKVRRQIEQVLAEAGLCEDDLKLRYVCPMCKDTGNIEAGGKVEKCHCYRQRMLELLYKEACLDPKREQTFENFDLNVFPDAPIEGSGRTQRQQMELLYKYALKYAEEFPEPYRRNLVLTGKTGTGKTFLLNCIAARVIQRGFTALCLTSSRLQEILREYAFNKSSNLQQLYDSDLLLIDELGMEPMLNNITIEYLFMVVNERIRTKKPILVSTNLTSAQLTQRYSERITSRLLDLSECAVFNVQGEDIRLLRRK